MNIRDRRCFTPRFTHFNSFLSLFIVLLLLLSDSFDCVYFLSQFLCGRQIQPVFTSKNCLIGFGQCHFNNGIVFSRTKQNSNGWVFIGQFLIAVVVVDIHLELSQILVCQLTCLQLKDYMAAQQAVIKNKIGKEFVIFKQDTFLTRHKGEPFSN